MWWVKLQIIKEWGDRESAKDSLRRSGRRGRHTDILPHYCFLHTTTNITLTPPLVLTMGILECGCHRYATSMCVCAKMQTNESLKALCRFSRKTEELILMQANVNKIQR